MKIDWTHLAFILILTICSLILFFWLILTVGNKKKETHKEYLIKSYSPMSDDVEIQKAYDAVRNK
jgi:hypothetical protein